MTALRCSRRMMLRGLGVSLALPWLELNSSRGAHGVDGTAFPLRIGFVFASNGAIMQKWTPQSEGPLRHLPPTLEPLGKVCKKVNVLSGLMQDNANAKGDGDGDHARSAAAFLTGAHPRKNGNIHAGVSIDQVIAQRIGRLTPLASLELGTERNRTSGQCDSGYSCAYSSNISWRSASSPMAKEINPKHAFARMFRSGLESRQEQARRDFYRKSVLDAVSSESLKLQAKLGQADRQKLDEYFTSIREIEVRIAQSEQQEDRRVRPDIALPSRIPSDIDEHIRLLFDVMAIAFQTDSTRVATYMLANEASDRQYQMVGVHEGHHILSHHKNRPDTMALVQKIDKYLISRFATFLETLDSIREGEKTLLDHSMIVYGGAISDANVHSHESLPILLAGRGRGTIQTGRHIIYPARTPMNNLFLSLLDRMGLSESQFGDSNGRLGKLDG
ncbi:DUF1552 domain-containing protein [Schlesneria paludicola]|uniref:DUF1552 domain-containing protein n=1 Tax=Schlesneria paludicola TaxID=360056 RepID=UPI00029A1652|nr:DUF1552 domain-containing protein [Schlesneria paludicola]